MMIRVFLVQILLRYWKATEGVPEMSQTDTLARPMIKMGLSTTLVASLAIPLTIGLPPSAFAYSFVKTSQECTQHQGTAKSLILDQGGVTDDGYRFECDTPALDRECQAKHDSDWYFDAEFGQCEYDSGLVGAEDEGENDVGDGVPGHGMTAMPSEPPLSTSAPAPVQPQPSRTETPAPAVVVPKA